MRGAVLGHAGGDALAAPVVFSSREERRQDPVNGMRGHGTNDQLPGTCPDGISLMLCLLEQLQEDLDLKKLASSISDWRCSGGWTSHKEALDGGQSTEPAIFSLKNVVPPEEAGRAAEPDNGNGSLMRILPSHSPVGCGTARWPGWPGASQASPTGTPGQGWFAGCLCYSAGACWKA